jgi:hypothetical protein
MVDDENKKEELKTWVFKAYIPISDKDAEIMMDWTQSCQGKPPLGFNNYRWHKISHDHLFVKQFKGILEEIQTDIKDIKEKLENKDIKDRGYDLFK